MRFKAAGPTVDVAFEDFGYLIVSINQTFQGKCPLSRTTRSIFSTIGNYSALSEAPRKCNGGSAAFFLLDV
ncbi:hypothetical protein [Pollutibacter soli]|uniref:hypothetical protein n=1 Tax=Pollutibacter soli TaxID=3034157 RepID=UPI0030136269